MTRLVINPSTGSILEPKDKANNCAVWFFAGIACSYTAGDVDVCPSWVLCVVRYKSLRRTDPSSKESYQLCCVIVCDTQTLMRRTWSGLGCCFLSRGRINMIIWIIHYSCFQCKFWKSLHCCSRCGSTYIWYSVSFFLNLVATFLKAAKRWRKELQFHHRLFAAIWLPVRFPRTSSNPLFVSSSI
jgi:hypothetical protein